MVFSSVTFLFYFLPIFIACYFLTPTTAGKNVVTLLFSLVFYAWGDPRFLSDFAFFDRLQLAPRRSSSTKDRATRPGKWGTRRRGRRQPSGARRLQIRQFHHREFSPLLAPLGVNFGADQYRTAARHLVLHLPLPFLHHRRVPGRGSAPTAIRSTSRSTSRSSPSSLPARSSATRPSPGSSTPAGRRWTRNSVGARIFIVGLAQKVLVADASRRWPARLSTRSPIARAEAWIGLLAYTVQLYFDFAGYSDMAIGLGMMLGFTFPRNFRMPYTSLSITEFWRRWHISLSSWLRDYLYIPLGGNRGTTSRPIAISSPCSCSAAHGTAPTGHSSSGACGTAPSSSRTAGAASLLGRVPAWAALALRAARGDGRMGAVPRRRSLRHALDYFASILAGTALGDISFDMHDVLNERAIATLYHRLRARRLCRAGCRWLSAPLVLRAVCGHRLDLRAPHLFDGHGGFRRLQPIPLFQILISLCSFDIVDISLCWLSSARDAAGLRNRPAG